jgi:hypothetical protein
MSENTDVAMESTASEVFDFENDGLQKQDTILTVVAFEVEEKENGTRHKFTVETPVLPYPIQIAEWVKHSTAKAQEIGRSNLKRLAKALSGGESAKYDAATVVGQTFLGEIYENDSGFTNVRKPRPAPAAAETIS